MTFNSSQQERLLAALERIADALEKQGRPPVPFVSSHPYDATGVVNDAARATDPQTTKGPYR